MLVVITSEYGLADVRFDYNAEIVEIVKQIPSRVYHPEDKYWTILNAHIPTLANWLIQKGHIVSVNGERWVGSTRERQTTNSSTNPFVAFMGEIPPAYREKAFRALTKVFHPDTGGDVELMKKLNQAKP